MFLTACEQDQTKSWMGKWQGPEGTFLDLSQSGNGYNVSIQDLDTLKTYQGRAIAGRIEFTRNGKVEYIQAGNGQDTGMKWLADKQNCLVIQKGEGYCRD